MRQINYRMLTVLRRPVFAAEIGWVEPVRCDEIKGERES
jgi:hypothetical protein